MAQTFVVVREDLADNRLLCLKLLHAHLAEEPRARAEFRDEVRLLSGLNHTQIVTCVDAHFPDPPKHPPDAQGQGNEVGELAAAAADPRPRPDADEYARRPWFVMEFVDGVDLRTLLRTLRARGQRLPPSLAMYIAAEICSPLAYVHEYRNEAGPRRVVHRDLCPSNVLVGLDGHLKLADFGIAKFETRGQHTETGMTKGQKPYMSPEHFRPARGLDHRSDLFALGVILYELLTGRQPFPDVLDFPAAATATATGDYEHLEVVLPEAAPELIALVTSLLEPDKNERPSSARQVRRALLSIAQLADGRDQLETLVGGMAGAGGGGEQSATSDAVSAAERLLSEDILPLSASGLSFDSPARTARARALAQTSQQPPAATAHTRNAGLASSARPLARRVAAWAFGALIVVSGTAIAFQQAASRQTPSALASPATAPAEPAVILQRPKPAPPSVPPPEPPEETSPTTATPAAQPALAAEPEPASGRRSSNTGVLEMVIVPWGFLSIDGKRQGDASAQTRVSLKPGSHRVEISTDEHEPPKVRDTVRIRRGETLHREYTVSTNE